MLKAYSKTSNPLPLGPLVGLGTANLRRASAANNSPQMCKCCEHRTYRTASPPNGNCRYRITNVIHTLTERVDNRETPNWWRNLLKWKWAHCMRPRHFPKHLFLLRLGQGVDLCHNVLGKYLRHGVFASLLCTIVVLAKLCS